MPDMSTIAAAISSFSALKDIAQAMIGLRDAQAFQAKLIEFNSALIDAQTKVFSVNEERTTLIERVRALEQELVSIKAWEAEKQRYQLEELPPGVFVYALKPEMAAGEPSHRICQTCYQRGKKSLLQASEPTSGQQHLTCHECGTKLTTGFWRAPPVPEIRSHY
ncbi:MAG: hypothetical protein ACHQRJ_02990 [Alphaproteobacteria bacterium]